MAEVAFGEWLKRQRGAKGWTQKQLAQEIHCSISALRKIEAEERRPSMHVIERLAVLFSIPHVEHESFFRFARGDWQALPDREGELAPWLGPPTVPRSNLPASFTSFIGREKELREVIDLISKNRVVTLAGTGGIGKTRLSLQVGYELLHRYPHGVWFIPLESLSNPSLVTPTIAAVFNIRESADRPVIEVLSNLLREKTALLILDNCEHLLESCADLVRMLLQGCPNLKILTTSREILDMTGEAIYQLSSLSLPQSDNISLENVNGYEAIQLFAKRAGLALSSFRVTVENYAAVSEICRRLDGIPLAIELSAAYVNILQVEEILEQLNESFALLARNSRAALPRHQTMRASMDWSWGLLNEEEQSFMRRLAVFAGGWTLESAQIVCNGDALGLMHALAKKSLIVTNQDPVHETRYNFHEIIRQYALEKLTQSGEEADARMRHLKYFLQLAENAEPALKGPAQFKWIIRLNQERDNLRAALAWAEKTDVEAGLSISGRLQRYWEEVNLLEGESWLSKFLSSSPSQTYPHARAQALAPYGMILWRTQKYALIEEAAEECLETFRALGDTKGEIDGLLLMAAFKHVSTDTRDESFNLLERALELSKSLGDLWRQASIYAAFAWFHEMYEARVSFHKEAISLWRKAGDARELQTHLGAVANLELLHGDIKQAQKHLDEAILLSRDQPYKSSTQFLPVLARMEAVKGNFEKARLLFQRDIDIFVELGNRSYYLWGRAILAHLFVQYGHIAEALEILLETTLEFQNDGSVNGVCYSLEGMAGIAVSEDRHRAAAMLIGWADQTRKNIHDPRPPLEQVAFDKFMEACLLKMGETAFAEAYDEGEKMMLEEAISLALDKD